MWVKDLVVSVTHIRQGHYRCDATLILSNGRKTFTSNLADLDTDLELFHIKTSFNILDTFDEIKNEIMLQVLESSVPGRLSVQNQENNLSGHPPNFHDRVSYRE